MRPNPFKFLFLLCLLPVVTLAQLRAADNVPITFYGKVLDQKSNAVPGAKVNIAVSILNSAEWSGELKQTTLETDQNGDFMLTGYVANAVEISSITKDGYELSKKAVRSYRYAMSGHFHSDPLNPVVFRMWKKGPTERLIVGSKFYGIAPDGRAYTIDFVRQEKKEGISPNGDIIVKINRPTTIPLRAKYDWSYSIEAVDGGIIRTDDEFMNQAPESGYTPKYELTTSVTNAHWQGGIRGEQFYLKSRSGQVYGRIVVEVIPEYKEKSIFNVEYFVNSAGSRNLEFDLEAEVRKNLAHPDKIHSP